MTADDVLDLLDAAEGWLSELTGEVLEEPERAWVRGRVIDFVVPRLDESAKQRIWVERLAHDLRTGKAVLVAEPDGTTRPWRGEP